MSSKGSSNLDVSKEDLKQKSNGSNTDENVSQNTSVVDNKEKTVHHPVVFYQHIISLRGNVAKEDLKFEERLYPKTNFICNSNNVEKEKLNVSQVDKRFEDLFRQLFYYLKGENARGEQLQMTAPVFSFMQIGPQYRANKIAMCFWLSQNESSVPEPMEDSGIYLWNMQDTKFYVRRFQGPGGEAQSDSWKPQVEKLYKGLEKSGLTELYDHHMLLFSSYTAPWVTKERRDEVIVRKVDTKDLWVGPWNRLLLKI